MKKGFLLLVLGYTVQFVSVLLLGSCDDGTECGGPIIQKVGQLNFQLMELTSVNNISCPQAESYVPDENGISYNNIGIYVEPQFTANNQNIKLENPFVQTAYACSPAIINPKIKTITITSDNDYTASLPKGADLSDIFLISNLCFKNGNSANDFISLVNDEYYTDEYYFYLTTAPDTDSSHQFTITITYDDDIERQIVVGEVLIKK